MVFWLLSVLGLLAGPAAQGQTATWQATRSLNAATNANITASATDGAGMVYLAGWAQGTAAFGSFSFSGGAFVAKWNPTTHSFVWVVGGGGPGTNIGSLAVDGTDVYVGGYFMGLSATFGPTTLTSPPIPINTSYSPNGFVAKLTTTATGASYAWAWGTGTSNYRDYSYVYGLAAHGGSVYVAGMVTGTVQLGATTVVGGFDSYGYRLRVGYLAKLTGSAATPAVTWSVLLNSSGATTEISSVAVAGAAVYVVGTAGGTASLGSTATGLSSAGGQVLAKLTDAGATASVVWAVQPSATKAMSIGQLAVQGTSLYLAGTCTGATLTLGTITQANPLWAVAVGPPASQVYVAKLTDLGAGPTYRWLLAAGGEGFDSPTALVATGAAVYVAGRFDSSHFTVGNTVLTNCHLTGMYGMIGPRNHEWFVARVLDGGGTASFAWAQRAGSQLADEVNTMTVSGSELYVAGETFEPASFTPSLPTGAAGIGTYGWLQESNILATTTRVNSLAGAALYPNPAHGLVTMHVPGSSGLATLTLLDGLGRTVRTQRAATGQDYSLDLAGLVPGVYALRVQAGAAVATQKLVVE